MDSQTALIISILAAAVILAAAILLRRRPDNREQIEGAQAEALQQLKITHQRELDQLRDQLAEAKDKEGVTHADLKEKAELITQLKEQLATRVNEVKAAHEMVQHRDGRIEELKKDFSTLGDQMRELQACHQQTSGELAKATESADNRLRLIEERDQTIAALKVDQDTLRDDIKAEQAQRHALERKHATLTKELEANEAAHADKLKMLEEQKAALKHEFQVLAEKILEEKSTKFTEANRSNIDGLLKPLQGQIKEFRERVDAIYTQDTQDRTSLKAEIGKFMELGSKLSTDANNLTKALRTDNKVQGTWGEIVLEQLLESAGLRKGHEFSTQAEFNNAEGQRIRPDVVIHLPENKHIIIDSKVSLVAYERYCNATEPEEVELHLKQHIQSLRTHIDGLGAKDYETVVEKKTLDFIVAFVPVEGALLAALSGSDLYDYAYKKNIVICGPSMLLATLKIIGNLWRYEKQNRNAQLIADAGGQIYDKLVASYDDFEKVSKALTLAADTHTNAVKRLYTGRGPVIKRAEEMKALGAKATKHFPVGAVQEADLSAIEFAQGGEAEDSVSAEQVS